MNNSYEKPLSKTENYSVDLAPNLSGRLDQLSDPQRPPSDTEDGGEGCGLAVILCAFCVSSVDLAPNLSGRLN